jgi:hypothetical protein
MLLLLFLALQTVMETSSILPVIRAAVFHAVLTYVQF